MSTIHHLDRFHLLSQVRPEVRIALGLSIVGWAWLLLAPTGFGHWIAMLLAMMLPALTPQIEHVRARSFGHQKPRAAALFILPYLGVWITAGAIAMVVFGPISEHRAFAPIVCLAAAMWQCSPVKRSALKRCHARPILSAFGRDSDRDIMVFGVTHAGFCMMSCLPMMLIMLGSHDINVMIAITIIILSERAAHQPNLNATLPALLLTAVLLTLLGDASHHHHMH